MFIERPPNLCHRLQEIQFFWGGFLVLSIGGRDHSPAPTVQIEPIEGTKQWKIRVLQRSQGIDRCFGWRAAGALITRGNVDQVVFHRNYNAMSRSFAGSCCGSRDLFGFSLSRHHSSPYRTCQLGLVVSRIKVSTKETKARWVATSGFSFTSTAAETTK